MIGGTASKHQLTAENATTGSWAVLARLPGSLLLFQQARGTAFADLRFNRRSQSQGFKRLLWIGRRSPEIHAEYAELIQDISAVHDGISSFETE